MCYRILLLCILSTSLLGAEPNKDLHTQCIYPTVQLNFNNGSITTGTIVLSKKDPQKDVFYNVGLTVSHGVYDRNVKIKFYSYKDWSEIAYTTVYNGVVYYTNTKQDLAIFVFMTDKEMPCAKLAAPKQPLYMGQEITKIGCGLGDPPRLDFGYISGVNRKFTHTYRRTQLSIYTVYGDSGSAIFDKNNNEIIGVLQSIRLEKGREDLPPYHNIAFALDINKLYELIQTEDGGLDFVTGGDFPVLPWFELRSNSWNENIRAIPDNPWIHN